MTPRTQVDGPQNTRTHTVNVGEPSATAPALKKGLENDKGGVKLQGYRNDAYKDYAAAKKQYDQAVKDKKSPEELKGLQTKMDGWKDIVASFDKQIGEFNNAKDKDGRKAAVEGGARFQTTANLKRTMDKTDLRGLMGTGNISDAFKGMKRPVTPD